RCCPCGCGRASAGPAGAEPHHLLLAIDDLEREVAADTYDDHVQRIRADVDGCDAHQFLSGALSTIMRAVLYIMPVRSSRSELLRRPLRLFTRTHEGIGHGDPRALHRTRVASRRLRELLPILPLDNNLSRKLSKRLREVTRRLGAVRELDVLAELVSDLRASKRFDDQSLALVAGALAADQGDARKRLRSRLSTSSLRRIAAKLEEVSRHIEETGSTRVRRSDRGWHWALDARIARRGERLDRAMREAGAVYLPDRLHAVRIAVKKL